jgi:hypothetical protein
LVDGGGECDDSDSLYGQNDGLDFDYNHVICLVIRGYARTAGWTEEQKKDQLLWSPEDKAGEYLTLLLERDPLITYPEIIEKVEKRFGFQDVP